MKTTLLRKIRKGLFLQPEMYAKFSPEWRLKIINKVWESVDSELDYYRHLKAMRLRIEIQYYSLINKLKK
jgi:hypothetical protein